MTHTELERDLASWLQTDAAAVAVPRSLERRIRDIPAGTPERRGFLARFWPIVAAPAAAAAGMAGVLAVVLVFGLFDAPPGVDGDPCNRRQTQRALDELRDADGYRFVVRSQTSELDREQVTSLDDPPWSWADTTVYEGAYLGPDRFAMRTSEKPGGGSGPLGRLQVGNQQWERWDLDGERVWVDHEPWPTANVAWGYIQAAMPSATMPAVSTLGFGESDVDFSGDLPGAGGCIAVAELPEEPMPTMGDVEVAVPDVLVQHRFLALRIEVASGRPTSILIGPAGDISRQGLSRTILELAWETPEPADFATPAASITDPWASAAPPAQPTPIVIGDAAWEPETLPSDLVAAGIGTAAAGDGFVVALGHQSNPTDVTGHGAAWLTDDGVTWRLVTPDGWDHRHPLSIAWDGDEFMAIVAASDPSPETYEHPVAEAWRSADGETWILAGTLPDGAQPGGLLAAGPGWVITGSAATNEIQMRPAIWSSRDGQRWTEAALDGTRSGRFGPGIVTESGDLIVSGCESPDDPQGPQSGSGACYSRLWRSGDGLSWEAGPIAPIEIHQLFAVPDGLLAVGSDPTTPGTAEPWASSAGLWRSADGIEWVSVPFPTGDAALEHLARVGDRLVALGARTSYTDIGGHPVAYAWRSTGGDQWEPIELGLPAGAIGSFLTWAYEVDDRLTFVGTVQLSEETSAPVVWREP